MVNRSMLCFIMTLKMELEIYGLSLEHQYSVGTGGRLENILMATRDGGTETFPALNKQVQQQQ
jgi:hypothetical protein